MHQLQSSLSAASLGADSFNPARLLHSTHCCVPAKHRWLQQTGLHPAASRTDNSHRALQGVSRRMRQRLRNALKGRRLRFSREVVDTLGAGPARAKPLVTFKADSGGIVSCSGDLLVRLGMYERGARSTVTCPASTLRFSALNNRLQIWGWRSDS
jgi:hypothetical protein